jgi:IS5 family transposase
MHVNRGRKEVDGTEVLLPSKPKPGQSKRESAKMRARFRRRAAIEPVISHLKHQYRLIRCFLKGLIGDQMNLLLAAAAWNLRKWLRTAAFFLASTLSAHFDQPNSDRFSFPSVKEFSGTTRYPNGACSLALEYDPPAGYHGRHRGQRGRRQARPRPPLPTVSEVGNATTSAISGGRPIHPSDDICATRDGGLLRYLSGFCTYYVSSQNIICRHGDGGLWFFVSGPL